MGLFWGSELRKEIAPIKQADVTSGCTSTHAHHENTRKSNCKKMASVAILFIVATVFVLTRCCPCREDVSPIVMCSNSELIRNEYLQHDNVARGLYGDCLPSVGEKYVMHR